MTAIGGKAASCQYGHDGALRWHREASGGNEFCEDRIGTGPPRARTGVIHVDLGGSRESVWMLRVEVEGMMARCGGIAWS